MDHDSLNFCLDYDPYMHMEDKTKSPPEHSPLHSLNELPYTRFRVSFLGSQTLNLNVSCFTVQGPQNQQSPFVLNHDVLLTNPWSLSRSRMCLHSPRAPRGATWIFFFLSHFLLRKQKQKLQFFLNPLFKFSF